MMLFPKYQEFTGAGVMAELRRFFYDTAQAANPIAMASLTKMVATSQILFGTDYPYRTTAQQAAELAKVFNAEDVRKIDRENAVKLVPRWR
jgi:6-methylsalicylate decarboxylase